MSSSVKDFTGVKIALIIGDHVLVTLRDDTPGLQFAGMWDFPGGGREGTETPLECIIREVQEELGFILDKDLIFWEKIYPAMQDPSSKAWFMAAHITQDHLDSIVFGDEGQGWKMMSFKELMEEQNAIPFLKIRMRDFIAAHQEKKATT